MENRIKELREAKSLTLQALADLVGTSNQQISQLEKGQRRLNTDWLERLSKPLDCHPIEILFSGTILQDEVEVKLLSLFRSMTDEQKEYFVAVTEVLVSKPSGE